MGWLLTAPRNTGTVKAPVEGIGSMLPLGCSQYLSLSGDPVGKCEAAIRIDPGCTIAHSLHAMLHLLTMDVTGTDEKVLLSRQRCQKLVEKGECTKLASAIAQTL